jgi:hypothetical protein
LIVEIYDTPPQIYDTTPTSNGNDRTPPQTMYHHTKLNNMYDPTDISPTALATTTLPHELISPQDTPKHID